MTAENTAWTPTLRERLLALVTGDKPEPPQPVTWHPPGIAARTTYQRLRNDLRRAKQPGDVITAMQRYQTARRELARTSDGDLAEMDRRVEMLRDQWHERQAAAERNEPPS